MTRCAAILAVLALVSCKEKPKPPPISPEARGAAFFASTADKLGDLLVLDWKTSKVEWYKEYMEQSGAKTDAELAQKLEAGKGILKQYPVAFALSEAQEAAMKAGKFADEENLQKVRSGAARFADSKRVIPDAYRIAMLKVGSGEWNKGLELEFTARLLDGFFHHRSDK